MPTQKSKPNLRVNEIARELRINDHAVRDLIESGQLPATDVSLKPPLGKRCYRVSRQDLDDFLRGRRVQAIQPRKSRRRVVADVETYV